MSLFWHGVLVGGFGVLLGVVVVALLFTLAYYNAPEPAQQLHEPLALPPGPSAREGLFEAGVRFEAAPQAQDRDVEETLAELSEALMPRFGMVVAQLYVPAVHGPNLDCVADHPLTAGEAFWEIPVQLGGDHPDYERLILCSEHVVMPRPTTTQET